MRAPMWVPPVRDPRSFAAWFERSTACVKVAVRRVGLIVLGMWLALGAAGLVFAIAVFDSRRGRELRGLFDANEFTWGTSGSSVTFELTDDEVERAWQLTRQIFWSTLPWLVVLVIAFAIVSAWTYALVAVVAREHVDESSGDAAGDRGELARQAFRRVPAVIASSIALGAIALAVLVLASLPVVLVAVAGAGAAAIVLIVLFCVVAGLVVGAWLWGRLGLSVVIAALGGYGLGLRRSWTLTHRNYWFVVGRLLIAGLIGGALGGAAGSFNGVAQFLGFVVVMVLYLLFNAVASAASTIVSACAQVVIVDQVDGASTGSSGSVAHA